MEEKFMEDDDYEYYSESAIWGNEELYLICY